MGYNWYNLNFEVVLTNTYYVGSILYPEHFSDIDPVLKADGIYNFFVDSDLYYEMSQFFGPFGTINLVS